MNPSAETDTALQQVVVALLAPAMKKLGGVDPELARQAAREAIAGYTDAGATNLIDVARSITLSLAAIDTLRLADGPDIAPEAKVKMRNSAASQARSARLLGAPPRAAAAPRPPAETAAAEHGNLPAETPDDVAEQQQALAKLRAVQAELAEPEAAERAKTERSQAWANAMVRVAADCAEALDSLPVPKRRLELVRVNALTDAATHMMRSQDRRRVPSATASSTEATTPTITVAKA